MPQLDKFIFISQLFWFVMFFITFYSLISVGFLSRLFKILRFRANLFNNVKISVLSTHIFERELNTKSISLYFDGVTIAVSKSLQKLQESYYLWKQQI